MNFPSATSKRFFQIPEATLQPLFDFGAVCWVLWRVPWVWGMLGLGNWVCVLWAGEKVLPPGGGFGGNFHCWVLDSQVFEHLEKVSTGCGFPPTTPDARHDGLPGGLEAFQE